MLARPDVDAIDELGGQAQPEIRRLAGGLAFFHLFL